MSKSTLLTCVRARTPELSSKLTPAAACSTVNIPSAANIKRAQGKTPRDISDVHLRRLNCDFLYVSPASNTASRSKVIDHWSIFVKALSSTTWSYGGINFTSERFRGTGGLKWIKVFYSFFTVHCLFVCLIDLIIIIISVKFQACKLVPVIRSGQILPFVRSKFFRIGHLTDRFWLVKYPSQKNDFEHNFINETKAI
jgi:hypothetical protein